MNQLITSEQPALTQMATTMSHQAMMAAAVIDKRLVTAKQFPRSISRFKKEATELLQNDIETARSAEYSKPVGDGKVSGPSIRLAEIAAMCWGNIEIELNDPVITDKSVTVQASAWDLERNVRVPGMASASIVNKNGNRYQQHMIETTILATASKARRNAIQALIPRAYINDLLEEARKVARANQKPLEQVRADMMEYFARSHKVTTEQVLGYLGVTGIDDITLDDIDELRTIVTSIKDGEPIETYFGPVKSKRELAEEKVQERRKAEAVKNEDTKNKGVGE